MPRPTQSPPPTEFAAWLPFILASEAEQTLPQLLCATRGDPPDVILVDRTAYLTGRALGELLDRPTVGLFPSFAWNEHLNLAVGPGQAPGVVAARANRLDDLTTAWGVAAIEVDDLAFGRTERAIVFAPREFQPEAETFPAGYHFVGPGLRVRRARVPRPSRIRSPGPTLYAALGTAFLDRSDALQLVADAMGRLGVSGLLAVGDLDPALVRVPPGVQVEGFVHQLDQLDQLAALAHTSVFATHAGMGAVMESLAAGIPMLCFPQTTEQAMVASRVAELGLGLVGLVGEPTSVDAVTHVATQLSRLPEDRELRDRVRAFGSTCPTTRESVPPTSSRTQRPTAPRPRGPPQDCQVSLRLLVSGSRPSRRGGPLDTD